MTVTPEAVAAIATVIGSVYTGAKYLIRASKIKKEAYRQSILKQAKEELDKVEKEFKQKLEAIKIELEAQKISVSRDLGHLKEVYGAEIKVLGEKIENLREDLSQQHQALVGLLTKLVSAK